jgi:hypothetical protein
LQLAQARVNRAQAARDLWVAQTRVDLLPFLPLGITGTQTFVQTQAAAAQQQQMQMQQQMQTQQIPMQSSGGFSQ